MKYLKLLLIVFLMLFITGNAFAETTTPFDSFEDGDFTNNPTWANYGSGTKLVNTNVAYDGDYSVLLDASTGNYANIRYESLTPADWDYHFGTWIYPLKSTADRCEFSITRASDSEASWVVQFSDGVFKYYDGAVLTTMTDSSYDVNNWYYIDIHDTGGTTVTYSIYDEYGNLDTNFVGNVKNNYAREHLNLITRDNCDAYYDYVSSQTSFIEPNGITAGFDYSVDKLNAEIDFVDTTVDKNVDAHVVLDDWNWYVDGSLESTDQNWTYAGVTQNTDYNIALSVCGNYDETEYCSYKEEIVNSGRWYADWNIGLYDENSEGALSDVTLSVTDGTNTEEFTISNGAYLNYDNNLSSILGSTTEAITLTFTKTGYNTRTYTQDLNKFIEADLDKDFMLLPEDIGANIDFRFFMPDRSTRVANTYITVQNWAKDNNYMERKLSDSEGDITFNLNVLDGNYYFSFDEYDYNSVALTVNRPKDEETAEDIPETWDLTLSGLAAASYQDISENSQLLAIYSNTVDYYILTVSSDSNDPVYLSRKYEIQTTGNPSTETLQPYLPESDIATAIKIVTEQDNGILITAYPNVTVKIYKTLSGEGRSLIEQTITDSKGEAFVSLIAGDTYEFEVYANGTIIEFFGDTIQLIKVAGSQIVFTINTAVSGTSTTSVAGIKVGFVPIGNALTLQTSGTRTITQTVYNLDDDAISATASYLLNGVEFATDSASGSGDLTLSTDLNWEAMTNGDLNVVITVTFDGNTYVYYKVYTIASPFGGYYDPIQGLRSGLKEDFGCDPNGICSPLLAIALILSAGVVIFASIKIGSLGSQATAILFGIFLTIFTYLTWVPLELIIVVWVLIFAFLITDRRGS